jgi:hypothetical protein
MTGVGTVRDVRLYLSVAVEVVVPVMASRGEWVLTFRHSVVLRGMPN